MSQTANPVDLGSRTAWWLRSADYSAKQVARVIGASEGTGKRLRAGFPPTTEQLAKLASHFGWRFLAFAFGVVAGPDDERLAADLDEIKRRITRLEQSDELDRATDAAAAPGRGALARAPGRMVAPAAQTLGSPIHGGHDGCPGTPSGPRAGSPG